MHTGYENCWLGQTNRQEPSHNLQKTNTARHAILTVDYNNYKPVPNQTHQILRTGQTYPEHYVNLIQTPNNPTSSNSKIVGIQGRGQPSQLYWTQSTADGSHPVRPSFGNNYAPQDLLSSQSRNIHYATSNSQLWQNNFDSNKLRSSDVNISNFYNNNNNNNNNYNNNYNNNNSSQNNSNNFFNAVGSQTNEIINGKSARIRVKDVFALNSITGTHIVENTVYDPRSQYACSLDYLALDNRKEIRAPVEYENANRSYGNSLNGTHVYEFLPTGQQDPRQLKSFQERNVQMPPEKYHFNETRVINSGLQLNSFASETSTRVPNTANANACNIGPENNIVRVNSGRTVPETSSYNHRETNRLDNYPMYSLPVSTKDPNKPPESCFGITSLLQPNNEGPASLNKANPAPSESDLNTPRLVDLLPSQANHSFNDSPNVPRSSSTVNNPTGCTGSSSSDALRKNEMVAAAANPQLLEENDSTESVAECESPPTEEPKGDVAEVVLNKKRSSDLILENPGAKFFKNESGIKVETVSPSAEKKSELQNNCEVPSNRELVSVIRSSVSQELVSVIRSSRESRNECVEPENLPENEDSNLQMKSPCDQSDDNETVHLSDEDIQESFFLSKNLGLKSKAVPEDAHANKNLEKNAEKLKNETTNQEESSKGEKKKEAETEVEIEVEKRLEETNREARIDRNKLDVLKDYIISQQNVENSCESIDDGPGPVQAVKKTQETSSRETRRRKLSKSSVVKNKNNSREMISVLAFKNARIEISKCPDNRELLRTSDSSNDSKGSSEEEKEKISQGKGIRTSASQGGDAKPKNHAEANLVQECENRVRKNSVDFSNAIKQEAKEDWAGQNKSMRERSKSCIFASPKKKETFEETAIINTMRAFQNLEYHYCMSCDLVSSNSSFWINVVSAELRCLNCFKKMTDRAKSMQFFSPLKDDSKIKSEKDGVDERSKVEEVVVVEGTLVSPNKFRKENPTEKHSSQKARALESTEKSRRKSSHEGDGNRSRHASDDHKTRETESSTSSKRCCSVDQGGEQKEKGGISEGSGKSETKSTSDRSDSTKRKIIPKDDSGSHVSEERAKKSKKQPAEVSDRTKRKSLAKEESGSEKAYGLEEHGKRERPSTEKVRIKSVSEEEGSFAERDSKQGTESSERSKRCKEDSKHSSSAGENKERKHSEERFKRSNIEKTPKSHGKKLDKEDIHSGPSEEKQREKSSKRRDLKEKAENSKSSSPVDKHEGSWTKKETKSQELKKEHKRKEEGTVGDSEKRTGKEIPLRNSWERILSHQGNDSRSKESKIKSWRRESQEAEGKQGENLVGAKAKEREHSGGECPGKEKKGKSSAKAEDVRPNKAKLVKNGSRAERGEEKHDSSVLLAELLKKTRKLSKALLEET